MMKCLIAVTLILIFASVTLWMIKRKKISDHLSQMIVLDETKAGRKWMAAMDGIMRRMQKTAFLEENIDSVIREVSADSETIWPVAEDGQSPMKTRAKLSKVILSDTEVFCLEDEEDPEVILLFLHGGAYLYGISDAHIDFCDELALKTKAKIFLPLYKRLPNHHCEEAMTMLAEVYRQILKEKKPVIFAGDSSGGGLALGFLNHCRKTHLPDPAGLILISPWLDVTLSAEGLDELEEKDMMLACAGLRICGKFWAGQWDVKDPRVSPIFGADERLPEIFLVTGTEELMFRDSCLLYERICHRSRITFVIGEGMMHDFPILAEGTEQGRRVREMIFDLIDRMGRNTGGILVNGE